MKKLSLRLLSALLCVCFIAGTLAGCASNAEKTTESEAETDFSAEKFAQLIDGFDPEADADLDAARSQTNDSALAGTSMNFTNSRLIEYAKISPNKSEGRNHEIDTITIHCMGHPLTIETCGEVYAKEKNKASANYGVGKDGRIAMYVQEKDRSWASSSAENDNRAVTIVVACEASAPYKVSDAAYNATIKLVTDICRRNKILRLQWSSDRNTRINHLNGANMTVHRDFNTNISCPGDYLYGKMGDIANQVNYKLNAAAKEEKAKKISELPQVPCMVKVTSETADLHQWGKESSKVVYTAKQNEVYTIVEATQEGNIIWGKVKSIQAWINLADAELI